MSLLGWDISGDMANVAQKPLEQGDPAGKAGKGRETSESISHCCGGDIPAFPFGDIPAFPFGDILVPGPPQWTSSSKQPLGYSQFVFPGT